VAVATTTGLVWAFGLHKHGVNIVGSVPGGLPASSLSPPGGETLWALAPSALAIGPVGFMESIAVAKVYAGRHRYEIDANRELIGLGLANIAGAFFSAYPTTGGFSQTAMNDEAGVQTTLAGLIAVGVIASPCFCSRPSSTTCRMPSWPPSSWWRSRGSLSGEKPCPSRRWTGRTWA